MAIDLAELPNDTQELKLIVTKLDKENERLESNIELLTDELALVRAKHFGRSSEKLSEAEKLQMRLFDEAEQGAEKPVEIIEVPAHSRKKRGRRPLPASLPREEIVHDIAEKDKVCSCGAALVRIGEDTSEQLGFVPAKVWAIRHIRPKYACKVCEGANFGAGEKVVKIAPPPTQIIPKSIATPSLLAYILVSKFCDALPFYRQEKLFRRIGIDIQRSTMCRWAVEVGRKCEPFIGLMHQEARAGPHILMDETPLQVMGEAGRADTSKSYMWVLRGGTPEHPVLLYQYHPSRSAQVPLAYLRDYQGYLQTDGYRAYDEIGLLPGIIHVGCWGHSRRKFVEAQKPSKKAGSAEWAIARIAKLYEIEKRLRALGLSDEEFVERRKREALPILDNLHSWLEKKAQQVPPSTLLGRAIKYALKQWHKLVRYLDEAFLTPDTNLVEQAIRPFAVGRRNWLFSGSPQGAYASATLFSLIESAKANGLEPYWYLGQIFKRLPFVSTEDDYRNLLPWNMLKK